jgi:hypothetical protein
MNHQIFLILLSFLNVYYSIPLINNHLIGGLSRKFNTMYSVSSNFNQGHHRGKRQTEHFDDPTYLIKNHHRTKRQATAAASFPDSYDDTLYHFKLKNQVHHRGKRQAPKSHGRLTSDPTQPTGPQQSIAQSNGGSSYYQPNSQPNSNPQGQANSYNNQYPTYNSGPINSNPSNYNVPHYQNNGYGYNKGKGKGKKKGNGTVAGGVVNGDEDYDEDYIDEEGEVEEEAIAVPVPINPNVIGGPMTVNGGQFGSFFDIPSPPQLVVPIIGLPGVGRNFPFFGGKIFILKFSFYC